MTDVLVQVLVLVKAKPFLFIIAFYRCVDGFFIDSLMLYLVWMIRLLMNKNGQGDGSNFMSDGYNGFARMHAVQ